MVNTVALLAPFGRVGSAALKYLLPAQSAGKVKLVLLIRPGSKGRLADVGDAKVVEVDFEGELDEIVKAIQGVQVIISCVNATGFAAQGRLLEAAGKLEGFGTFIPASFSTRFFPEDINDPGLKAMVEGFILQIFSRAQELGVGTAHLYTGIFDEFFFSLKFTPSSVKENVLELNKDMMDNGLAITTMDHLGAALAYLATLPPAETAGKEVAAVTVMATGRQLIEAFTNLHNGTPPTILDYDEETRKADYANPPFGPVSATYKRHWETGKWEYPAQVPVETYDGKGDTVQQIAKKWL